ncbi:MAG TPA: hypothetical protein DCY03_13290 [Planctomycetaceae bacterium]|nr:hypothetical protein [Planctomycetaceae bacterium]
MRNMSPEIHYARKTEQSYVKWIERFLRFHRKRNQGRCRRCSVPRKTYSRQ